MAVETREAEVTALEALGRALSARGFTTHLHTPEGHVASLSVANPWAPRLDETVVAGEGSFWWGWGQRITPVADIKEAAGVIGHVLSAGASST
jgi:hypothetical protein